MVCLDVSIIGGGLIGVATAYTIQRAGHNVTVIDMNPPNHKSRGALASPPNMTRILEQWGLTSFLQTRGTSCDRFNVRHGNGEFICYTKLHEQFLAELCAGFYFIQHADLYDALYNLASNEGVKFRQSVKVASVDPNAGLVALESGETVPSHLIIGADGADSIVRQTVVEPLEDDPLQDVITMTVSVLVDDLEGEDLEEFKTSTAWHIWLGDGFQAGAKLVHGRSEIGISITGPFNLPKSQRCGESWTSTPLEVDSPVWENVWPKLDPRLQAMLRKAKEAIVTTRPMRPCVEQFVGEGGNCVLVGDAAHPLTVAGNSTTALGIEDAQVLGTLMSYVSRPSQLSHLLSAYEELRLIRCHEGQSWDAQKRKSMTLPYGEEQRIRDARWRAASSAIDGYEQLDEETFYKIWSRELAEYSYDAREAAEDWWTKWGPFLTSKDEGHRKSTEVEISRISVCHDPFRHGSAVSLVL